MRSLASLAILMSGACLGGHSDDVTEPVDAPADAFVPVDAPFPPDAPPVDGPPGGNAGFMTPTAITKANVFANGAWTELGDADWSCHGTASTDQPSVGTVTLTGRIDDFQTGNGVGAASITAWSTSPSATVGTATTSDQAGNRGQYTITLGALPSGTRRYGFTLTAAQHVSTRVVGVYYPPGAPATGNHEIMSESTATALPAFIGVVRDTSKGMFLGSLRDCQGRHVSNAIVGISATPAVFTNAGGTTFYFSAGSSSLPVRHSVSPTMNKDGRFMVINAEPAEDVFIQAWGFRSTAELGSGNLTLLAQIRGGVGASAATMTQLEALRN